MKLFLSTFLAVLLLQCQSHVKSEIDPTSKVIDTLNPSIITDSIVFDFDQFKIQKNQLGEIKIGMTISEAEMHFNGLEKKTVDPFCFGFDGGGLAYLYSVNSDPVFGLIPKRDNDTVLCIIAVHEKLRTTNGLNPTEFVRELLKEYPQMMIELDIMNMWNFFEDETNEWRFVFDQVQNEDIDYGTDLETPKKPTDLSMQSNWITIY